MRLGQVEPPQLVVVVPLVVGGLEVQAVAHDAQFARVGGGWLVGVAGDVVVIHVHAVRVEQLPADPVVLGAEEQQVAQDRQVVRRAAGALLPPDVGNQVGVLAVEPVQLPADAVVHCGREVELSTEDRQVVREAAVHPARHEVRRDRDLHAVVLVQLVRVIRPAVGRREVQHAVEHAHRLYGRAVHVEGVEVGDERRARAVVDHQLVAVRPVIGGHVELLALAVVVYGEELGPGIAPVVDVRRERDGRSVVLVQLHADARAVVGREEQLPVVHGEVVRVGAPGGVVVLDQVYIRAVEDVQLAAEVRVIRGEVQIATVFDEAFGVRAGRAPSDLQRVHGVVDDVGRRRLDEVALIDLHVRPRVDDLLVVEVDVPGDGVVLGRDADVVDVPSLEEVVPVVDAIEHPAGAEDLPAEARDVNRAGIPAGGRVVQPAPRHVAGGGPPDGGVAADHDLGEVGAGCGALRLEEVVEPEGDLVDAPRQEGHGHRKVPARVALVVVAVAVGTFLHAVVEAVVRAVIGVAVESPAIRVVPQPDVRQVRVVVREAAPVCLEVAAVHLHLAKIHLGGPVRLDRVILDYLGDGVRAECEVEQRVAAVGVGEREGLARLVPLAVIEVVVYLPVLQPLLTRLPDAVAVGVVVLPAVDRTHADVHVEGHVAAAPEVVVRAYRQGGRALVAREERAVPQGTSREVAGHLPWVLGDELVVEPGLEGDRPAVFHVLAGRKDLLVGSLRVAKCGRVDPADLAGVAVADVHHAVGADLNVGGLAIGCDPAVEVRLALQDVHVVGVLAERLQPELVGLSNVLPHQNVDHLVGVCQVLERPVAQPAAYDRDRRGDVVPDVDQLDGVLAVNVDVADVEIVAVSQRDPVVDRGVVQRATARIAQVVGPSPEQLMIDRVGELHPVIPAEDHVPQPGAGQRDVGPPTPRERVDPHRAAACGIYQVHHARRAQGDAGDDAPAGQTHRLRRRADPDEGVGIDLVGAGEPQHLGRAAHADHHRPAHVLDHRVEPEDPLADVPARIDLLRLDPLGPLGRVVVRVERDVQALRAGRRQKRDVDVVGVVAERVAVQVQHAEALRRALGRDEQDGIGHDRPVGARGVKDDSDRSVLLGGPLAETLEGYSREHLVVRREPLVRRYLHVPVEAVDRVRGD